MRQNISKAIQNSDEWVIRFGYKDAKGNQTQRVVSPIRFLGRDRFLGLCLCREEPRQFYLERCEDVTLRNAHEFVMPVQPEDLLAKC